MSCYRVMEQIKFNHVDVDLKYLSLNEDFDFYLLCKPDIPWEEDRLRRILMTEMIYSMSTKQL